MIGKIKGKLIELENNIGLIETMSGVSYQVYLPPSLISPTSLNHSIEVYTYLHITDDQQMLFGFENKSQHNFFKMLLKVPGVGPKTAFSIVSFAKVDNLIAAVKKNDIDYFTEIPGLGRKTATKIILELASALKTEFETKNLYLSEKDKTVVDALISLGFKASEARKSLSKIPQNLSVEEKIKRALKYIK